MSKETRTDKLFETFKDINWRWHLAGIIADIQYDIEEIKTIQAHLDERIAKLEEK